jgi:hypothetical protein
LAGAQPRTRAGLPSAKPSYRALRPGNRCRGTGCLAAPLPAPPGVSPAPSALPEPFRPGDPPWPAAVPCFGVRAGRSRLCVDPRPRHQGRRPGASPDGHPRRRLVVPGTPNCPGRQAGRRRTVDRAAGPHRAALRRRRPATRGGQPPRAPARRPPALSGGRPRRARRRDQGAISSGRRSQRTALVGANSACRRGPTFNEGRNIILEPRYRGGGVPGVVAAGPGSVGGTPG